MKFQSLFFIKNKKNIIILSSAEFAHRMVKVKVNIKNKKNIIILSSAEFAHRMVKVKVNMLP